LARKKFAALATAGEMHVLNVVYLVAEKGKGKGWPCPKLSLGGVLISHTWALSL